MGEIIWTIFVGALMLVPMINIIVGAIVWGWKGFFAGLIITILAGLMGD